MPIHDVPSLTELEEEVKKHVVGQDKAVNSVCLAYYKYLIRCLYVIQGKELNLPINILLMGPTGNGKTHLIKTISRITDIPFIEINSKSINQEGWAGTSFLDLVASGLSKYNAKQWNGFAVIFIDEFDKIVYPHSSSKSENHSLVIQSTLLKYIEGFKVDYKEGGLSNPIRIDFSRFLFVFAGAFSLFETKKVNTIGFSKEESTEVDPAVLEKLIEVGMLPEIAGRITSIVQLKPLTVDDYYKILLNENFLLTQWHDVFKAVGIDSTTHFFLDHMAKEAYKKKLGVRGLAQVVNEEVDKVLNQNKQKLNMKRLFWRLL